MASITESGLGAKEIILNNNIPLGLPPLDGRIMGMDAKGPTPDDAIIDTLPILELSPKTPRLSHSGSEFYRLTAAMDGGTPVKPSFRQHLKDTYNIILKGNGTSQNTLKYATLNNNPPTESYSNDYEESMFASSTDAASKAVREFTFATGTETAGQGLKTLSKLLPDALSGTLTGWGESLDSRLKNSGVSSQAKTIGNAVSGVLMGHKLDFPHIWKSSGWSPSYRAQIRLYNPYPNDSDMTHKYITAPLATLMMFVTPRSVDGHTFFWPWLCSARIAGLFNLKAAYIKTVTVTKGGDDNHIAYNQRPGIVDVTVEIGSLYDTMVNVTKAAHGIKTDTPTVLDYLNEFGACKGWSDGAQESPPHWINYGGDDYPDKQFHIDSALDDEASIVLATKPSSISRVSSTGTRNDTSARVTPAQIARGNGLVNSNPGLFNTT